MQEVSETGQFLLKFCSEIGSDIFIWKISNFLVDERYFLGTYMANWLFW